MLLETLMYAVMAVLVYMTAIWMLSVVLRNASIVDVFWGLGFVILAWIYFVLTDGNDLRRGLVVGLTTVWGLRLTVHIGIRNRGKGEDKRYAKWRSEGGPLWWLRSYFTVFLLQGALMLVISAPLLAAQHGRPEAGLTLVDFASAALVLLGLLFEVIADWQLARFKQDPANDGTVCAIGLWRYSRHPNYFGEMLVWWGLFGLAALSPHGWVTLISPLLMTLLLLKVSGVTLLESDLRNSKPGYAHYIKTTNAFFPWFPRSR